ncbi:hypothetical protein [Streptomyces sp. NPDC089795]|uniref:hypothetical protein n=1 Tax=Streptomyces sp. NPDC089795 TaxID=3155297 RepID=UPI00341773B5
MTSRHRSDVSLLIKPGESVKTVSEHLGHTDAAMTLNVCTPWRRGRGTTDAGSPTPPPHAEITPAS